MLYWGYIGIMEKEMEATIVLQRFGVQVWRRSSRTSLNVGRRVLLQDLKHTHIRTGSLWP